MRLSQLQALLKGACAYSATWPVSRFVPRSLMKVLYRSYHASSASAKPAYGLRFGGRVDIHTLGQHYQPPRAFGELVFERSFAAARWPALLPCHDQAADQSRVAQQSERVFFRRPM